MVLGRPAGSSRARRAGTAGNGESESPRDRDVVLACGSGEVLLGACLVAHVCTIPLSLIAQR